MHPSRTRSVLTALAGLLAVLATGLAVLAAAPAHAASTDITINEVESSGDTRDWVELTNTGSATVDVGGWILKDNDDAHSRAIAAGTAIAPGGYLAVDVDDPATPGSFGLGGADSARLYLPDGSTLVDSYSWTAHAATTYGRCPDGTGAFVSTLASTKGAANACPGAPTAVRINEFSSTNPDFVELINTGSTPVDLTGWVLKDSTDNNSYTFPAASSIAAGARLLLHGEGVDFAFGLGNGDSVRLFASGDLSTPVDSFTYPAHAPAGHSYSRCPEGTGDFVTTGAITAGTANDCAVGPVVPDVAINEVESNGDTVGDWVELRNNGAAAVDVSGWKLLDSDPAHVPNPAVIPAGTSIPAGGYYSLYTEFGQTPGFGLGGSDSATLYLPDGTTQVDSYSWTTHAATTYGRCPDGTGAFTTTITPTRNGPNACSSVVINEIESSQGSPDDWIELKNVGSSEANIGGWSLKDDDDADNYVIPSGTVIAAGGYQVFDKAQFGFGLGSSDAVRLYDGSAALVDSYTWTAHATQTYGRCKDGVGSFVDTKAPTKGTANSCPGLDTLPWPGSPSISYADNADTFVQDLSGLAFDPNDPDVLWAAQNKKGTLYKLVRDASDTWVPAPGWPRDPTFGDGQGHPDTEGITLAPDGFVYMTSERDNDHSGVSRNTILRFDPNAPAGSSIVPTTEWDLNTLIPATGANLGLEGVTYVPDSYLTANGFTDQSTGAAYDPTTYPLHGNGLFVVAVEQTGNLVAFALDSDGTAHKVATIDSGFTALADVDFDPELGRLRAVTDDTFDGETSLLRIDGSGDFVVEVAYDRPAGMPNLNNEGLAVAPQSRCVDGLKEVLWSDDGDDDGHSLRRGAISCTVPDQPQDVAITSIPPTAPVVGQTYEVTTTGGGSGNPVVLSIGVLGSGHCSLVGSTVHFDHPGACPIRAEQAAGPGYLAGSASQDVVVGKAPIVVTTTSTSGLRSVLTLRITYTTRVTSAITGLPVAGVPVTTQINGGSPTSGCTATTNAAGVATCTVGPISIALWVGYTASAAETAEHRDGSGSAFIGLL